MKFQGEPNYKYLRKSQCLWKDLFHGQRLAVYSYPVWFSHVPLHKLNENSEDLTSSKLSNFIPNLFGSLDN